LCHSSQGLWEERPWERDFEKDERDKWSCRLQWEKHFEIRASSPFLQVLSKGCETFV
jgi:hypothetical protein